MNEKQKEVPTIGPEDIEIHSLLSNAPPNHLVSRTLNQKK